ncbi:FAD-binding oxidoreductase [Celeribacter indicus]|uniref:Oxidoreductase FAD/NAD(P)-binding subunit n=1 Tax=Celeribacter indicus TaxID=1208324 RepID=A0A0B5DR83_9RHOB|nr:FAD-binding oxidoreductase [Celeribacter indicus]AJE46028.1 oxidoreductase FAD/NAD(P)-binding subunit [Celeribacter indicus]SDX33183.1 Ferredoxin-NADP reductase [Celeribacter indicus]
MSTLLTLEKNEPVTHDTRHLVFTKPEDFNFTPGEAVKMKILREGLRDEERPFSPVSDPEGDTIEFIIKSYPDHNGVTKEIPTLRKGEMVEVSDPHGAIHDKGPGVFIAGGAGITPFLGILRERLRQNGSLSDCTLIFSNKTERDIICREEFENAPGLRTVFTVTEEPDGEHVAHRPVDRDFLADHIDPTGKHFYVCGPKPMISDVVDDLKSLGVPEARIVIEDLD